MHLPCIQIVPKEMYSICEELSDSVLILGELVPMAANVKKKKKSISLFLLFVQIFRDSRKVSLELEDPADFSASILAKDPWSIDETQ